MKKLLTITLIIAATSMVAQAGPIGNNELVFISFEELDLGGGLTQYTFFLNDKAGAPRPADTVWTVTPMTFSADGGQGIYNTMGIVPPMPAFNADVDTQGDAADKDPSQNPGSFYLYNLQQDSWWYDAFQPIGFGVPNEVGVGDQTFTPSIEIGLFGQGGSGTPFVQLVSDGDLQWSGGIGRAGVGGGNTLPVDGTTASGGPGPGESQETPHLPKRTRERAHNRVGPGGGPGMTWEFGFDVDNAETGQWFDPPLVEAFLYEASVGTFATVGVPMGIDTVDNMYDIELPGVGVVATIAGGDTYDFGSGVTKFWILDIEGPVDAEDATAFPTFLVFNDLTATFTMTGVPEPATMSLMLVGAIGMIARKRRRS